MDSSNVAQPLMFVGFLATLFWTMRWAAGRLAPSAAFGPIVFLVTRTPVLVGWGIGAAVMADLLLSGAAHRGRSSLADLWILSGLSIFCGLGFAALGVAPIWAVRQAFMPAPTFALEPGEVLIEEVAANHFLNGEARGGRALITNRRVGFRPHRFNVQLDTWSARLEDIESFEVEGARFLVLKTAGSEAPTWLVLMNPQAVGERLLELAKLPKRDRTEEWEARA